MSILLNKKKIEEAFVNHLRMLLKFALLLKVSLNRFNNFLHQI